MEIIKHNKYFDYKFTCYGCGTVFRIADSDVKSLNLRQKAPDVIDVRCPVCGKFIIVSEDSKIKGELINDKEKHEND